MKIGLFTDSHHSSQEITCQNRYNSRSLEKIKEAYAAFKAEGCELVICLGDLTDKEETREKEIQNLKEISEVIKGSLIETYCLMGNHDAFTFTQEDFYKHLGGFEPKNIFADGKNLILLDACHFKSGAHYQPGDTDWTDTFLPNADELEKLLSEISGDTYIFMHQNIDPCVWEDHRLSNSAEVCRIIEQSGKVKAVYQGHFHFGKTSEHNGVKYITLPAMCERENAFFIEEI